MVLRRFIPRLALFFCLLFVIAACSQTVSVGPGSATAGASPQANTSTPSTLQALQQRSLHLPVVAPGTFCPTTPEQKVNPAFGIAQGAGPAYASVNTDIIMSPAMLYYSDAQHFGDGGADNQGWGGVRVLWFINPRYQGLVLVRGHQLDGPHEVRFNRESDQPFAQQLVIDTTLGGSPWPNSASYTRLQAPGCYAYQVDGDTFSEVIVFQAIVQNGN